MKVGGLAALFGYAFFKFGWSYRLFNYCTILFGSIPMMRDSEHDVIAAERAAERVIRMNIIAAGHFNEGLRAIFLSIGYLGWFINPYVFMLTTTIVIGISMNADHQSITAMLGAGAAMVVPKEAAVTDLYHAVKRVWKPVYETRPLT